MAEDNIVEAHTRQPFLEYWNKEVTKRDQLSLGQDVRLCRARKPKKKEMKGSKDLKDLVRVQFAIDTSHLALELCLIKIFEKHGGIRKFGPAPKGHLEREASKLLSLLEK